MKDELLKHLHDIREAAAIKDFVAGKGFDDYSADELLRSGVERKFEIIGEALNRIQRADPELLSRIRDHRDVISFRNILAHGYDSIRRGAHLATRLWEMNHGRDRFPDPGSGAQSLPALVGGHGGGVSQPLDRP